MSTKNNYDVIVIGGSYAGLSAALALGRASISTLVIDSGTPCNKPTPHSHNFLTQDGKTPSQISATAKDQVLKYPSIEFREDLVSEMEKVGSDFYLKTNTQKFTAKQVIFATGIKDIMPNIDNFKACWGKSIIHCPYCHGYEFNNKATAILGNSEYAYEFSKMILNWSKDLIILTNGPKEFSEDQLFFFKSQNIKIIEKKFNKIEQSNGQIDAVQFEDKSSLKLQAMYARLDFEQQSNLPASLACKFTESGHIEVDMFQQTSVEGILACGDNNTPMRSVSNAVAQGTFAGVLASKNIINSRY